MTETLKRRRFGGELKFGSAMQEEGEEGVVGERGEFILRLPAVVFLQPRSKTPLSG